MKNRYKVDGNNVTIYLNRKDGSELETIISSAHLGRADEFSGSWCARFDNHTHSYYVYGHITKNGKKSTVQLHNWLMQPGEGMKVDHKFHNTLDNRIDNLRIVTNADNLQNRRGAQKNSNSGIRGVSWHDGDKKWRVRVNVKGKCYFVGNFNDIKDAERAAIEARAKYMPYSQEALASAGAFSI